ncbi:MAG: oxacillin-hydrolyzing class D beta-lactamase OXA-50 [Acidimicrobiales bacterium]|nr:MAG: oxacillin-hydrolyzing class D beta-lactamase OXA-50 [Acidimicrobiales bacterium]
MQILRARPRAPRTVLAALAVAAVLAGCAEDETLGTEPAGREITVEPAWAQEFEAHGVVGTFALHRLGDDHVTVHAPDRAATPMIPASTFKILNSAIALETGVIAGVDTVIRWDGVDRAFAAWNRDQTLRSAIEVSAVWAYQELARGIGPDRMAEHVAAVGYGNADIGGPIDEFWLQGDLRISAVEQTSFLADLMTDRLPFAVETQAAVREILIRDRGTGWTFGHKTGTALAAEPTLGWLVGFTEYADDTWVFALNIDVGDAADENHLDPVGRQRLAATLLVQAGALPEEALD